MEKKYERKMKERKKRKKEREKNHNFNACALVRIYYNFLSLLLLVHFLRQYLIVFACAIMAYI